MDSMLEKSLNFFALLPFDPTPQIMFGRVIGPRGFCLDLFQQRFYIDTLTRGGVGRTLISVKRGRAKSCARRKVTSADVVSGVSARKGSTKEPCRIKRFI